MAKEIDHNRQIDPNSPFAEALRSLFRAMSESQRKWQDEIGFGEEGNLLRAINDDVKRWGYTATTVGAGTDRAGAALRNYYMVKLGLIMTEASEAFDEMRKHDIGERYYSTDEQGNAKPEGVLSELADIIIRIWSLMGETELADQLVEEIIKKLNYNTTRAKMHGGKAI